MRTLLELPLDVLGLILREVRTKRDLRALCLVCSALRTLAIPNLYRSVDLTVEDAVLSPRVFRCLLDARNNGVRFVRKLRVVGDWNYGEAMKLHRSSQRMRMVNVMVLLLLQRIGQLQVFEWLLPASISPDVLDQLQSHHPNLLKLSWKHDPALTGLLARATPIHLPRLTSLSAQNVTTPDQLDYTQRWISTCRTLRKLDLSTNWDALKPRITGPDPDPIKCFFHDTIANCTHRPPFRRTFHAPSDSGICLDDHMEDIDHHPIDHRLHLDTLKLTDFPIHTSAPLLASIIHLPLLTSLTLHSCPQTHSLLSHWRLTSPINLHTLHLLLPPHTDAPLAAAATNAFLAAFRGLRELTLLSRVHTRYPMDELSRHADTLRRLVIDLKTSPRARLYVKHERLVEIYRNYRALRELGVSVQFSSGVFAVLGLLAKQLVTLVVLNTRKEEDARSREEDAGVIAKAAVGGAGGRLRVVCMAVSAGGGGEGEEVGVGVGRREVFYVQRAVNILGVSVPILTRIGVEKAVELERGRVGILKAGWGKCGCL